MKKIVLLVFVMLLLTCLTWAKPISIDQAKQVARNIMVERSSFTNPTIVDNIIEKDKQGQALYYIFNFRPASFVMVAAEDNVVPVLGYSFDQLYSNSNHPIQFDDMLYSYRGQIQYARDNKLPTTAQISNEWQRLNVSSNDFIPINTRDRDVAPILQSTWGQESYYNAYTPGGTPVGCVAVAMGQVMKRWAYPTNGIGSNSYTPTPYPTQTVDFSAATYYWSLMPNALTSSNAYVAQLLYHLGVSVNMQYAPGGSGAYDTDAKDALRDNFGYKNTLSLIYKNAFTEPNWISTLKAEIDAGRPMYYSGRGPEGGHAFNLDGYQTSGDYFHFNWGWYGYYNGYFLVSNLNPGGTTFSSSCAAIIGIEPSAAVGSLSESFEGVTVPAIPTGWAINPSATWVTSATTPAAGLISAYYGATSTNTTFSGKRLITPKLTVVAGNTISFVAKRGGTARGETVLVKWSTDLLSYNNFSTAQTTGVLTATATTYTFNIGTLKAGDYYVAFETYSANTPSNLKQIWLDTVVGPTLWVNPSPIVTLNTTTWNAGNVAPGAVGTSGNNFAITNTGGASLTVTSATITGTGATKFSTNFNTGTVLQHGSSYAFGFNYEPTTYTSDTATFTLVTNGGTVTVALSGLCQYNVLDDGFETYTDFAIDFPPWTNTALTSSTVYTITGTTFANQSVAQSFMVFNPSATTPPLTGDVNAAHSGAKMAICMSDTDLLNDDYLITPALTLTGTTTVGFWAKSYTDAYGLERFKVQYSTTTNAVASFTTYLAGSASTYVSAPTAWTYYSYSLPSTAKYVAIHCVSADAFFLMVDDFIIHDSSTPPAPPTFGNLSGVVTQSGTSTPIPNALVTIGLKSAYTNASGAYTINNVLTGTYTVSCSAPGTYYFSTTQANVVISNGVTTEQAFGLKWATIAASPDSLYQALNPFATADQTLTISNPTGTDNLSYAVYMQTSARGSHKPNFGSNGMKQKFANINSTNSAQVMLPALQDDRGEGWADYSAGYTPTTFTWAGPERGVYYSLNDWGLFSNGVTLTQLRHMFYEDATNYPWGTDTTFRFKIYASDGATVLYTSPTAITALKYPTVTSVTLASPMTFTDDFIVVVVPTNATTGMPASLGTDETYGYSIVTGETNAWDLADFEFIQGAYIAGDEWCGFSSYSGVVAPGGTANITVHFDAANLNNITKTANAVFVNNSNYIQPSVRGDEFLVPLTLHVNDVTTPIPVLNTTTWSSITASSTTASSGNVFTLSNMGIGTLTVSSITNLSGTDFSTTFVPGSVSLTNGQSYAFGFSYHPLAPGVDNVTFNIVTSNGTVTVTLEGYGDYTLEGFEGTTFPPDGWARVDQDADTYNWYVYSATGAPYEGTNCAASDSYMNAKSSVSSHNGGSRPALTPDNYLITPKLAISSGDVLKYYIAAQDPAWPAEHYSVKVSTTDANITSFSTELFAETLVDGSWHLRTLDLSAYAHNSIYLAFEHHACTDQFVLKLDNVLYPVLAAPLTYGTLKGNVFEYGTVSPIQNATVTINGLSAVTDIDGYYEIPNILTGTYDAVCTKPAGSYYFNETVTGIVIEASAETSQDFGLTWAELGVDPTSFDVTVAGGGTADRSMTITNPAGTADLQYAIALWDTSSRSDSPVMASRRSVVDMSKSERLPENVKVANNHDRAYGWYGYASTDDADIYTWAGTERATKYVLHDLGLLKPVTIQEISTFFYDPSATPWVDATFHFVIYAADGTTPLYTSPDIEGVSLAEVSHVLTEPLVVNGDFYVATVPTDASSSPFTLGTDLYSGNSYYKSSGVWTLATSEYLNYVYAEGAGWLTLTNDAGTVIPGGSAVVGLHFDATGLDNTSRSCTIAIYNNSDNTTARGVTRQIPVLFTITAGGIDAPTGIVMSLDGDNPVISWDAVIGAATYKVYGSNDPFAADWGTALGTVTAPTTTWTDTSGMLYRFYKITAVSGAKREVNIGKPVRSQK